MLYTYENTSAAPTIPTARSHPTPLIVKNKEEEEEEELDKLEKKRSNGSRVNLECLWCFNRDCILYNTVYAHSELCSLCLGLE